MCVVVTPSARERFTPRELSAAYEDFTERGPQNLNTESGLRLGAYRFGTRVLIVSEELDAGLVVLDRHPTDWQLREPVAGKATTNRAIDGAGVKRPLQPLFTQVPGRRILRSSFVVDWFRHG